MVRPLSGGRGVGVMVGVAVAVGLGVGDGVSVGKGDEVRVEVGTAVDATEVDATAVDASGSPKRGTAVGSTGVGPTGVGPTGVGDTAVSTAQPITPISHIKTKPIAKICLIRSFVLWVTNQNHFLQQCPQHDQRRQTVDPMPACKHLWRTVVMRKV